LTNVDIGRQWIQPLPARKKAEQNAMSQPDLVLLHAPSVYDFRQRSILYGPISDLIPSCTIFLLLSLEMRGSVLDG
jgi:hypothetical protein